MAVMGREISDHPLILRSEHWPVMERWLNRHSEQVPEFVAEWSMVESAAIERMGYHTGTARKQLREDCRNRLWQLAEEAKRAGYPGVSAALKRLGYAV